MEVWPQNWPSVMLFMAVATQWRVGMGGATGLDYSAVAAVMDIQGVKPKKRAKMFEHIRIMEATVLEIWAENKK